MPACILVSGFTGDMNQKGRFEKLAERLEFNNCISIRFNPVGRGINCKTELYRVSHVIEIIKLVYKELLKFEKVDENKISIIARGQGAYSSIAASENININTFIFWGAILYPKTSRELQGDYHSFRENGFAELIINEDEKYKMPKEYFDDLEHLRDSLSFLKKGKQYCFLHSKSDDIAPFTFIEDFCEIAKKKNITTNIIELNNTTGHMHRLSQYTDDYILLSENWLSEERFFSWGVPSITNKISAQFYRILDLAKESILIKVQNPLVGGIKKIKSNKYKSYFEPEHILIKKCAEGVMVKMIVSDKKTRDNYFKNSDSMASVEIEKRTASLIRKLKNNGAKIKFIESSDFPEICFVIVDYKLIYIFWYGFKEKKALGASLMHNDPKMCEYYTKMFNLLEEF